MSDGNRAVIINDPDGLGAEIIGTAPLSDTGQRGIGVRILSALGGAGGGGPATIVDGGDVAQGTTTDADTANTTIGILKKIKNLLLNPLAVTGTFWQAIQPVSGTFWQATQPVSGPQTDAEFAARLPFGVTGPLTDAQLRAVAVPVSGTVTSNVGTTGGLALDATVTGVAKDATLGGVNASPGAYTVLDNLGQLVSLSKKQQVILQALVDNTKAKVVLKSPPTLLHRS